MYDSQRPLSLGEILDRTTQIFRRNFLLFAGIAVLPSAIGVGFWASFTIMQFRAPRSDYRGLYLLLLMVAGAPISMAFHALLLSATNFAALHASRGEKTTIRAAGVYAASHLRRHFWLLMLETIFSWTLPCVGFFVVFAIAVGYYVVTVGSGTIGKSEQLMLGFVILGFGALLFAAGVWIWLRYSLAFAASVTEEMRARPSMKRSSNLSKGARARVFVMCLMIYVLQLTIYFAIYIPASRLLNGGAVAHHAVSPMIGQLKQGISFGVSFLLQVLLGPVYSIALMLFYLDQRTRKEGYDIELLMAQAGWAELPLAGSVEAVSPGPFVPSETVLEGVAPAGVNLDSKGS
jgi:hypothetical protein